MTASSDKAAVDQPAERSLGPSPVAAGELQLSLAEAQAAIAAAIKPVGGIETVPLQAALGRVLAADVVSSIDVPAHPNAAMDGYAFSGAALLAGRPLHLRCVGTALAGQAYSGAADQQQCVRITTGAVMPAGLDTVVPLELCQVQGDAASGGVHIPADTVRPGDNRRLQGEDLAKGQTALRAGRVLQAADVGLLASLGIAAAAVRPRLRVAVFSTGDELRDLGQPLDPGCVYDSNRHALLAAVQRLGMEAVDLGVVRDEPAALQATLERALAQADAVLTSGGVSAGEADHTRDLLVRMGKVAFWKVALRPGRPFAFGPVRSRLAPSDKERWLFALPGNPVAALVSFYALVRDGLLQLAGATPVPLPTLQARSTQAIRKRPGRTELQRGLLSPGADGRWHVTPATSQGAGILSSLCQANALIVLGHSQGPVPVGAWVDVWLFDGLI